MKIALIIIGVIVALLGLGCTVGGGALLAVAGTDGWIESDTNRVDSATYALVSEPADIEADEAAAARAVDKFRLRFEAEQSTSEKPVFLGIGRTADVDRYLEGVERDIVTDVEFDNFHIEKDLITGTRTPARPTAQDFWRVSTSGTGHQEIDWKLENGSYRIVMMNADASKGVDLQASAAVKIPWVVAISISLIIAGVVGMLIGVLIVVLAARSVGKRRDVAPPPSAPSAPPPPAAETAP